MKNYRVTLKANSNIQDWYVRCDSEQDAERLVVEMNGALAEPKVTIVDGNDGKVSGLALHPNRPVQHFPQTTKLL